MSAVSVVPTNMNVGSIPQVNNANAAPLPKQPTWLELGRQKFDRAKEVVIGLGGRISAWKQDLDENFTKDYEASGLKYENKYDSWAGERLGGNLTLWKKNLAFVDYGLIQFARQKFNVNLGNEFGMSGLRLETGADYANAAKQGTLTLLFATTPHAQIVYGLYNAAKFAKTAAVPLIQNRKAVIAAAQNYFANRGNQTFDLAKFVEEKNLGHIGAGLIFTAAISIAMGNTGAAVAASRFFAGYTENLRRNNSLANFTPEAQANYKKLQALVIGLRATTAINGVAQGILHAPALASWYQNNVNPNALSHANLVTAPQAGDDMEQFRATHARTLGVNQPIPVIQPSTIPVITPAESKTLGLHETITSVINAQPNLESISISYTDYVVKPGDTLNDIAHKFGYENYKPFVAFNGNLHNPDLIGVGSHLRIPDHAQLSKIIDSDDLIATRLNAGEDVPEIAARLNADQNDIKVLNPVLGQEPVRQNDIVITPAIGTTQNQINLVEQIQDGKTPVLDHSASIGNVHNVIPVIDPSTNAVPTIQPEATADVNVSYARIQPIVQPIQIIEPEHIDQITPSNIPTIGPDESVVPTNIPTDIPIVPTIEPVAQPTVSTIPTSAVIPAITPTVAGFHANLDETPVVIHQETQVPVIEPTPHVETQPTAIPTIEPTQNNPVAPTPNLVQEIAPEAVPSNPSQTYETAVVGNLVRVVNDSNNQFHSDNPGFQGEHKENIFNDYAVEGVAPQFNHELNNVAQDGQADSCFIYALNSTMTNNTSVSGYTSHDPAFLGELILQQVANDPEFKNFVSRVRGFNAAQLNDLYKADTPGKVSQLADLALQYANIEKRDTLKNTLLDQFGFDYDVREKQNFSSMNDFEAYIQNLLNNKSGALVDINAYISKSGSPVRHYVSVIGYVPAENGNPAYLIANELNRWQSRTDSEGRTLLERYTDKSISERYGIIDISAVPGTQSIVKIPLNDKNWSQFNKVMEIKPAN